MRGLRTAMIVMTVALIVFGAVYLVKGFKVLLFQPNRPSDLSLRWVDQQYIFKHQNPYDVLFRERENAGGEPAPRNSRNAEVDPSIGRPLAGGYPPWSFAFGALMYWPS